MKTCYVEKKFQDSSLDIVERADRIMDEYATEGYDLTLRQLYYQFVARGWIENSERSYKRLGKLISDARLAGLLHWDVMVDRTRELHWISHWDSPAEIVRSCAKQYRIDTRADQPNYIEVWVEKEALAGIVLAACKVLDVHCLIDRGFVSQSAMWQAARRLYTHQDQHRIIIYLGDHDPSGLDMSRDILDRINDTFGVSVEVRRIALTLEQIEAYQCPPNPAKVTDSRYQSYQEVYGDESWELDALEPKVLSQLILDEVTHLTDVKARRKLENQQKEERRRLQKVADSLEE